jgi:hypothetical protein
MTDNTDPFAGYTSAELRAAADAKDSAHDQLKPWRELHQDAYKTWVVTEDGQNAAARVLRDGAAKLLGVTL